MKQVLRLPQPYLPHLTAFVIMEKLRNSSKQSLQTTEQPDTLLSLHRKAVQELSADNHEAALSTLKRTEELLEAFTTQGAPVDQDLVLCTLNNIACCYQK